VVIATRVSLRHAGFTASRALPPQAALIGRHFKTIRFGLWLAFGTGWHWIGLLAKFKHCSTFVLIVNLFLWGTWVVSVFEQLS
jgi:hypothetical protein